MSRKAWIYVGVAVVALLYLYSKRSSATGAGGNAVGTAANADIGGASFGAIDPTAAW
jgi:hypothetical protein